MLSHSGLPLLPGKYLLHHDEYSSSDDLCFPTGHIMSEKAGTDTIHYELEEDFLTSSLESQTENDHLRQNPTEDEYLDHSYLPLLSQPDSTPASLFSGPIEVEENESLSQCFVGTESLVELSNCCCSDLSCGVDPLHVSSDKGPLPSGRSCGCNNTGTIEGEGTGGSLPTATATKSCPVCGISSSESPRKPGCTADSLKENGPSSQCTCALDSSSADPNATASSSSNTGEPSDGPEAKHQNAKRNNAGSHCGTSDSPAASGESPKTRPFAVCMLFDTCLPLCFAS